MKPRILVCATAVEDKNQPYLATITAHKGEPVLLHPGEPFETLAAQGVLLTGGGDLGEETYDHPLTETERKTIGRLEPDRDISEKRVLTWAANRNIPVLGICRGCQMMNSFAGGTLISDIPIWREANHVSPTLPHQQDGDPSLPAHPIRFKPSGRLYEIMGRKLSVPVNSSHHQAIARCGSGLEVTARAEDGVIEGVEDPSRRFWIGVQFHPERMWKSAPEFQKLFEAFIEAARTAKP